MRSIAALSQNRDAAFVSIACILVAAISFSIGDLTIKRISETRVPLHQAVAIRSVIALALTLIFMRGGVSLKAAFRTERPVQHMLRGIAVLLSNLTYFAALAALPIANATAIFFVAPMMVTAMSAIFVRDYVGPVRWAALVVGFAGVLFVVRPGSADFQWVLILPILSAAAYATMQTMTRNMGTRESAVAMALYVQVSFLLGTLLLGLVLGDGRYAGAGGGAAGDFLLRPWVWPTAQEFGLIALTGVTIAIGGYLISQAYRLSPAGIVAPFEYTSLVLAVIWGFLIWGDIPDSMASIGISLILVSGIVIAIREARAGRKRPSATRVITRR